MKNGVKLEKEIIKIIEAHQTYSKNNVSSMMKQKSCLKIVNVLGDT